jgi:hypothetical protein
VPAQIRELIDRYDPCLFWFDTWAQNSSALIHAGRIDELIGLIRAKSPECLVNSRIGAWGHPRGNEAVDFLSMGDNHFPAERIAQPWETSGTMNESWGYHQGDFAWKPSRQQIAHLIANTARGGNYQLNVGPLADGSFPAPPSVACARSGHGSPRTASRSTAPRPTPPVRSRSARSRRANCPAVSRGGTSTASPPPPASRFSCPDCPGNRCPRSFWKQVRASRSPKSRTVSRFPSPPS